MNKIEYHQLFISKVPIVIDGFRAYNALIDATLNINEEEKMNKGLERIHFNNSEIDYMSKLYQKHAAQLRIMGVDPLDHFEFTQADKDYIDQFMVKKPWHKRLFGKLFT